MAFDKDSLPGDDFIGEGVTAVEGLETRAATEVKSADVATETTPEANSKGPAPFQGTPETTEPTLIPADQVKPEEIGTLSIEYRDGQPAIVVSGGKYIPAGVRIVNSSGRTVAFYGPVGTAPSAAGVAMGAVTVANSAVYLAETFLTY
ncbi:hypothetical protein [Streptomyces sp. NPDC127190]|uniref:hypothetical protein n=1 Tax=unclassified Streptomyces TaxID=2593676 RepID=UPI00363DAE08